MASILRLGSRQARRQILKNEKSGMFAFVRPVTLKAQPAQPPSKLNYDERNTKLGRPVSPHLTIYSFPMPSMLSISHRATGMVLAGYAILLGSGALILPDSIGNYLDAMANSPPSTVVLFSTKCLLAFPLTYHFWNGIRHLLWDLGMFLTLKEVYATGYAILGLTIATTIALLAI